MPPASLPQLTFPFDEATDHSDEPVERLLKAFADGLNVVVAVSCAILGPNDFKPSRMGRTLIDFANGRLWSGVNTAAIVGGTLHVGIGFFVVRPSLSGGVLSASVDDQGYVGVPMEERADWPN